MESGAFNIIDETMHQAVMIIIQSITLIVGLVLLLLASVCLVSAACAFFREVKQSLRRRMKPGAEPDTQDISAEPVREQESQPHSLPQETLIAT